MEKTFVNGYLIQFNDYWKTYQVWHEEIGFVGEYKHFQDAELDCIKG